MKILSFDVETANISDIGSICAVGWVLLNDNNVVKEGYSLINPGTSFSKKNISIHGITPADVACAPSFADYWRSTLCDLMSSSLVIAHSANFDISAVEQALFNAGLPDPGIDYMDSIPIFQYYVDSPSYKLKDLAMLAGYEYSAHHAGEDALALVHVLKFVQESCNFEDLSSFLLRSHVPSYSSLSNTYIPKRIQVKNFKSFPGHMKEEVQAIGNCLCGLKFCITGDIQGYEREDIERMIAENGGRAMTSVSGKTDYLILGTFENPDTMTSKHKKALELIAEGGKIKIIFPEEFFCMIGKKNNDV